MRGVVGIETVTCDHRVEHRTAAVEEAEVMISEPSEVINTGDAPPSTGPASAIGVRIRAAMPTWCMETMARPRITAATACCPRSG